jgi:regulator of sigma E protease
MQVLEYVFYLLITLGILVFVHELGHFLAAKLTRMRVERFSIGFPPRAFGKTIGDTDYCVSWIPLGGYVKISGMVDESFDTEHVGRPPEPYEFRARPIWARMLVISAGVIMNLFLAQAIFWGINYQRGKTVWETTEIGYVAEGSPAASAALRAGDRVLRVNGTPIANWDQIYSEIYLETLGSDLSIDLLRDGSELRIVVPRDSVPDPGVRPFGIIPPSTSVVISMVEPGKPADRGGLKPGDILLALDSVPLRYDGRVRDIIRASAGRTLAVRYLRGTDTLLTEVTPNDEGKIGISYGARYSGPVTRVDYTLPQAFLQGLQNVGDASMLLVRQVALMIGGKVSIAQSVGGPIRIAQVATQSAEMGLPAFLGTLALLSVSLAILNILPFPALDGGHLVFLIYEAIFRREIPVRVKLFLQKAGIALLLLFMGFVLYNDIVHF